MKLIIDIPEEDIPKTQKIQMIGVHFIDGKVCGCTYPYEVDVLDKIRAEIIEKAKGTMNDTRAEGIYMALNIVDKYKAESEDKE